MSCMICQGTPEQCIDCVQDRNRTREIARLTAEVARLKREAEEGDNAWLARVEELQNEISTLKARNAQQTHCAAIADIFHAAKTMVVASDVNTPSCATEPSPASACETATSARPMPEQAGPTTTRPGVSDGATAYVVMAHRGGDVENHTYCAAVCSSLSQAKTSADEHEQYRGGKYACSICEVPVGMFNEDASDFVEVRKVTPIPGWKTALQRVLDDRDRDRRVETAERELAALRDLIARSNLIEVDASHVEYQPPRGNPVIVREGKMLVPKDAEAKMAELTKLLRDLATTTREFAALRSAVRWCVDNGRLALTVLPQGLGQELMPTEHAEALRKATT